MTVLSGGAGETSASVPTPSCLYCRNHSYEPLFDGVRDRLGYVPGTWAFLRCTICGSAILVPHPSPDRIRQFYPPIYDFTLEPPQAKSFSARMKQLEYRGFFAPMYAQQAARVLQAVGASRGSSPRLLDIGCGYGLRLLAFRRLGCQVFGADFRPEVVAYLRRQLRIPALCVEGEELARRLPVASMDVVTAFHVVEHVSDVRHLLACALQVLRPGGWLVMTVPLVESLQAVVLKSRWVGASEAPRHLSIPSQVGIERLCREVGFAPVRIRADHLFNCLGIGVLSLMPAIGTRHAHDGWPNYVANLARAILAGAVMLPWCLLEQALDRPAIGMVVARKPDT